MERMALKSLANMAAGSFNCNLTLLSVEWRILEQIKTKTNFEY